MMNAPSALLLSLAVPLITAVAIVVCGNERPPRARRVALIGTLVTLVLACYVVWGFDVAGEGYFAEQRVALSLGNAALDGLSPEKTAYAATDWSWIPDSTGFDIRFSVGLDGLSVWMYALSAVLMVTAVLVSWEAIREQPTLFYAMLMLLEAGCLGVFVARDLILFYVFFEFTLIPLFFLIGIWGSEARRYAAIKFFLYTLAGSLLTFLGLLAIVIWNYSQAGDGVFRSSLPQLAWGLAIHPLPMEWQMWIFAALFAGFAIKVPLFPLHTWLPLAHVQAPTAGSVLLAGILLKIGTYGFLRFSIPWLPDATAVWMPWILTLSVAGIIYGALVALVQADMKRLIAYSSVSHLGFCMLGLFALNPLGVQGAALQMVNHGVSTGALFALVGMLYERYHTREISHYGGLARRLPVLTFFVVLFTFSSIGLPGMNGFAGEIMILSGMFQRGWFGAAGVSSPWLLSLAVAAVSGVVLGAWYMLWLVQRVFFGKLQEPAHGGHEHPEICDLGLREIAALVPLAVLVFWLGLYPQFFLQRMEPALREVTRSASQRVTPSLEAPATAQVAFENRE